MSTLRIRIALLAFALPAVIAAADGGFGMAPPQQQGQANAKLGSGAVAAQLSKPVTLDLKGVPFSRAIATLRQQAGFTVTMPVSEGEVAANVTFACKGMSAHKALTWITSMAHMTWSVSGQTVVIAR
jgi:hypothetical protein